MSCLTIDRDFDLEAGTGTVYVEALRGSEAETAVHVRLDEDCDGQFGRFESLVYADTGRPVDPKLLTKDERELFFEEVNIRRGEERQDMVDERAFRDYRGWTTSNWC